MPLSEDPPNSEDRPPPAVKADTGADQHRSHERLECQPDTDLRVEIGVLMRVEHGSVFDPATEEYRSAREIRESTDFPHGTDGRDRVVVAAPFPDTECIQDEGIANCELTCLQRFIPE